MTSRHDEWATLKFSERFSGISGAAFQDLFSELMEAAHPGDFVRVRAAGPTGDLKCDGYILSTAALFQVYAPRKAELTTKEMVAKVDEDFAGALQHWPNMKSWTFVHSDTDGDRAERVQAIAALQKANPGIVIRHWSKPTLLDIVLALDAVKRASLLGPEPEPHEFARPPYTALEPLLSHIATRTPAHFSLASIDEISPNKLAHNQLSHHVAGALERGRKGEAVVERFIDARPDPTYGPALASAFNAEYTRLRDAGNEPDDIFHGLTRFVGGDFLLRPPFQTAIYAVLAYFFERCDIFEAPP